MADARYTEASRCPWCEQPGKLMRKEPVKTPGFRPGTMAHIFNCDNERCKRYQEWWIVQVNPDGTVPPPNNRSVKAYPTLITPDEEKRFVDSVEKQIRQETSPEGGEVGRGR